MRRCHVWFQLCLMVLPLGTAEPRSHTSGTLGKTYLRKVKTLGSSLRERNIPADRYQAREGEGESAPGVRAEIPPQSMKRIQRNEYFATAHGGGHSGADVCTAAHGEPYTGAKDTS